jgi:hypothetical protein
LPALAAAALTALGVALVARAGAALVSSGVVFMALAASPSRFLRREFVRRPFFMRGAPAFAGDLALLVRVHRCESPVAGIALPAFLAARIARLLGAALLDSTLLAAALLGAALLCAALLAALLAAALLRARLAVLLTAIVV